MRARALSFCLSTSKLRMRGLQRVSVALGWRAPICCTRMYPVVTPRLLLAHQQEPSVPSFGFLEAEFTYHRTRYIYVHIYMNVVVRQKTTTGRSIGFTFFQVMFLIRAQSCRPLIRKMTWKIMNPMLLPHPVGG